MSLPSDQKLAKIRILHRRAELKRKRLDDEANAAKNAEVKAWLAYMERARELGYCGMCERHLKLCRCVALAKTSAP